MTFIKLPFVIKVFVLSIFEWPFYTGFTVQSYEIQENIVYLKKLNFTCENIKSCISHVNFFFLFDSLHPSQLFFSYVGTGVPGLNQYYARINVSCSRTQQ